MKIFAVILLFAFSCHGQNITPMPQVVRNSSSLIPKVRHPAIINLVFAPSKSPGIVEYLITAATNGVVFETTNVIGTNAVMEAWGGVTNTYYAVAEGLPASRSLPFSHSAWYVDNKLALVILTNGLPETNIVVADSTNCPTAYYRDGVGQSVVVQIFQSQGWSNIYSADVDLFPVDFTAQLKNEQSLVNIP